MLGFTHPSLDYSQKVMMRKSIEMIQKSLKIIRKSDFG